jgi:hypothetical protein
VSSSVARVGKPFGRIGWLWWTTAVVALLGFVLRLPFFDAPLTADEGGYAEVARLWARGDRLYKGAWVDRPQGLLLVFRGALAAGLSSTAGLRVVAAGFAVILVFLAALVAQRTSGPRRGLVVAGLASTAGASPFIESFTLSGELIASVLAAAAILAFTRYMPGSGSVWLVLSGLCAGSSWMVKQSGVDAAFAVGLCLAFRRAKISHLALFASSVATPVAIGVLLSGDPEAWYGAVVGYGLHASGSGIALLDRWTSFRRSFGAATKALGPTAVLAAIGWRRSPILAKVWLAAAAFGILLGGGFHPHYYLELVVPLALVASFVPFSGRLTAASAAIAAAITLSFAAPLWNAVDDAQARAIWPRDAHLRSDSAVAVFVRMHTRPSQRIYVLWAAADVYYLADRPPALRYLWLRNVQTIPGAVASVRQLLDRRAAALVVVEQAPSSVDPSGATARALHRSYRLEVRIDGVDVYRPRR